MHDDDWFPVTGTTQPGEQSKRERKELGEEPNIRFNHPHCIQFCSTISPLQSVGAGVALASFNSTINYAGRLLENL